MPEKGYALVAILAGNEAGGVNRSQIRTILWADSDREKATANLRQLIARIHRIEERFSVSLLVLEGETVALAANPDCSVDYRDFLVAIGGAPSRCEVLLPLWQGTLLEGIAFGEGPIDDWLESSRDQLRQRFLDACRQVLEADIDPADADARWRLAHKVLEIDPTEEAAYRALMRICIARGDRGFALRIYSRCKRVLLGELGVRPDRQTLDLAALLRHQEAESPVVAPYIANIQTDRRPVRPASGHQTPAVLVMPPVGVISDETIRAVALGFVEEITVGLTRFRRFSVVASQIGNAVAFESRSMEEALAILDVDYAITVSLMPAMHGHRFGVRLTDMSSAGVLWATHIDFTMATLGERFERVIGLTVRSLVDMIDASQLRLAVPPEQITAYRYCLEGSRLLGKADLQAIRRARKMFKEAMAQTADYAAAMTGLSRTLSKEWLVRGVVEDDLLKQSITLADKASELDPLDGRARRERGYVNLYMRRHDESLEAFEAAIRLNPNDPDILTDYADALAHYGEPQRGLTYCRKAIDLNPTPPDDYLWTLGSIFYQMGEYQRALDALRPMENSSATARLLSACAAQLGNVELARRYSRAFRSTYPKLDIQNVRDIVPNRDSADTEHLIEGLRLAGLG